jgi:hypothetical protein
MYQLENVSNAVTTFWGFGGRNVTNNKNTNYLQFPRSGEQHNQQHYWNGKRLHTLGYTAADAVGCCAAVAFVVAGSWKHVATLGDFMKWVDG